MVTACVWALSFCRSADLTSPAADLTSPAADLTSPAADPRLALSRSADRRLDGDVSLTAGGVPTLIADEPTIQ
ncbi:MAG: hypothetical protein U0271_07605 [Polyangiaceae bacterium]